MLQKFEQLCGNIQLFINNLILISSLIFLRLMYISVQLHSVSNLYKYFIYDHYKLHVIIIKIYTHSLLNEGFILSLFYITLFHLIPYHIPFHFINPFFLLPSFHNISGNLVSSYRNAQKYIHKSFKQTALSVDENWISIELQTKARALTI